jgi:hypothetical protein
MKKPLAVVLALASLLATPAAASAQTLCAIPLIIVGAITSATEHRELTQKEAMWCGFYHEKQPAKEVKAEPPKTTRKTR